MRHNRRGSTDHHHGHLRLYDGNGTCSVWNTGLFKQNSQYSLFAQQNSTLWSGTLSFAIRHDYNFASLSTHFLFSAPSVLLLRHLKIKKVTIVWWGMKKIWRRWKRKSKISLLKVRSILLPSIHLYTKTFRLLITKPDYSCIQNESSILLFTPFSENAALLFLFVFTYSVTLDLTLPCFWTRFQKYLDANFFWARGTLLVFNLNSFILGPLYGWDCHYHFVRTLKRYTVRRESSRLWRPSNAWTNMNWKLLHGQSVSVRLYIYFV
jgi:hypothetical protein